MGHFADKIKKKLDNMSPGELEEYWNDLDSDKPCGTLVSVAEYREFLNDNYINIEYGISNVNTYDITDIKCNININVPFSNVQLQKVA